MKDHRKITIEKGIHLELLFKKSGEWNGIGAITVGGVRLRDGSRPAMVRIDTPDGVLYTRYVLKGIVRRAGGVTDIRFRAIGLPWGRQEYMDEYIQQLVAVNRSLDEVEDLVTLSVQPERLQMGGRDWIGFSYSFRYESRRRRIHRVLFDATWELGGSIEGNTVLSQSQCSPPVYRGARSSLFVTTCLKTLEQYGSPQGVSYQLAPRGGMLQAFDFQYGPRGALLQYWPEFGSICSDLQSPRGSSRLHVLDEYRFPLANRVATSPQHVLYSPGVLAEHEARDLWWEAYEHVYGGIRRKFRIKPSVVRPESDPPSWGRFHKNRPQVNVAGEWVDVADMVYAFADRVIPKMIQTGLRRTMGPHVTENDVSVLGMKRKIDDGIHGDHLCGSICCTHRFFPSEFWGGIKAWRYLYRKSRDAGIELGHWIGPHMSPRAAIFKEHPEWLLSAGNTLTTAGGYWNATAVLDWNSGVYDWVLNDLRRWAEEGGLDYLFVDSLANLGMLQMNYAHGMRTNLKRLAQFIAELQAVGIKAVSFEGISPLGVSRIGMADLRKDKLAAMGGIVGQNDFGWWYNEEDMAYNVTAHLMPRHRTTDDVQGILFRLMANRGGAIMPPYRDGKGGLTDWYVRLNHIYEQALPYMKVRRLLPDRGGIRWLDGKVETVWAFKDLKYRIAAGSVVERIEQGDPMPVEHKGQLSVSSGEVYRIRRGAP